MNPFRNDPPTLYRAAGYQVDLDRLQPVRGASCGRVALLLIVAGLILMLVCGVVYEFIRSQTTPPAQSSALLTLVATRPPASQPTVIPPTLDSWSLTGTAFALVVASPTLDYCWWQTPTAVPSAAPLPVTPDGWALQGTAYALATGTPTFTPVPTQPPPRAWCDLVTPIAEMTATFTPFPLPTRAETTQEAGPPVLPTEAPPAKTATATLFPEIKIDQAPGQPAPPVQPAPPEQVIVIQTQVVIIRQTAAPAATRLVIVTATPTPTFTATATFTPTATETPTETATSTATPTATESETPTSTPTATETPEPTVTPIPTEIPLSTQEATP